MLTKPYIDGPSWGRDQTYNTFAARTGKTQHQTFVDQNYAQASESVCRIFDMLQLLGIPVYEYDVELQDIEVVGDPSTRREFLRGCKANVSLHIPPGAVEPSYRYVEDAIAAKHKQDKEARLRQENPMLAELYKEYEATLILCGE